MISVNKIREMWQCEILHHLNAIKHADSPTTMHSNGLRAVHSSLGEGLSRLKTLSLSSTQISSNTTVRSLKQTVLAVFGSSGLIHVTAANLQR